MCGFVSVWLCVCGIVWIVTVCVCGRDCRIQVQYEPLLCGHVFHSECIKTFATIRGITKAEAWPYKCLAQESASPTDGASDMATATAPVIVDNLGARSPSPIDEAPAVHADHQQPVEQPGSAFQAALGAAMAAAMREAVAAGDVSSRN